MKHFLLFIASLACLFIHCGEEELCHSDVFSPNGFKDYLPYQVGDRVSLADSAGNQDTITLSSYQLT